MTVPFALRPSTLPFVLSLSKDELELRAGLSKGEGGRSWFDKLTTNGCQ